MSRVEWKPGPVLAVVQAKLDADASRIADWMLQELKITTAFSDKTGILRKSFRKKKSKFERGGYVVISDAPHAPLVEYGHGGKHPAPAHPFIRPVYYKAGNTAKQITGAK